jgi:two-component system sensor kinase FixL
MTAHGGLNADREISMIDLTSGRRSRVTDMAGATIERHIQRFRHPLNPPPDVHVVPGISDPDCNGTGPFLHAVGGAPLQSAHLNAGLPFRHSVPGERDLVDSPPKWWSRAAWLRGRDREKQRMFDMRVQLRDALEILPLPVIVIDQRDRILFATSMTTQLFGYSTEELLGASFDILFPMLGEWEGWPAVNESRSSINGPPGATNKLLLARRRNGSGFFAEATIVRSNVCGQVLRIATISDRSACGEAEQNLTELAHLARVSSLGELGGALAHEMNQPLAAILSNAQAAQRFIESGMADANELREALKDIVADSCRASEVIQKIRMFIRKGDIELKLLDLGDVVHDVALLVRNDALVRGIRISFDIARNLANVCGDKIQLEQVVLNLLLNACDAVKECGIAERAVETTVCGEPGGGVRITVKDYGQGLTLGNMDQIFRSFYTTKPQGLGLGLSISRSIVTAHGGRLWAENNPGKGAAFHVTLPSGGTSQISRERRT